MKFRGSPSVFLSAAGLLGLIFASPTFGDPDAYYHLWMAKRIAGHGPVLAFPWLPFTTLAEHYADQHFLYHLALIPFLTIFGDFWGLKIATVMFAALALTVFSLMLKAYGVRRPMLWALIPLFAPGFVFRLLLTKATALALTALFLFLIALRKEMRLALFGLAFAYVWLHASWPILVIAALLDAFVRRSARFLPAIFAGLALGLVANPSFPQDFYFYWEQIVQVALVGNHAFGVAVGMEWYPADFLDLIIDNLAMFLPIAALAGLTVYAVMRERPSGPATVTTERRRAILLFASLAGVFLFMTVRQARHKEYFLPLMLCATALAWDTAWDAIDLPALAERAKLRLGRVWMPMAAAAFLGLAVFAGSEALYIQRVYAERPVWTRFADVGAWMRANLPEDSVVFQTAWDDTPLLLYRDDAQRYIAGLDPRFFSDKDLSKYWEWRDIGDGRRRARLASLIENDFGSRYVFVKRYDEPLRPLIKKDPSFERVYQDSEAEIWMIR